MIRRSLAFLLTAGLIACQAGPLATARGECPEAVEARAAALAQQEQVREEFARDWRAGCEANYGESCSSDDATQEMQTQRDALLEQWWSEIAEPKIAEASLLCEATRGG